MITMAEYYIVIHEREMGAQVAKIIAANRACGRVEPIIGFDSYKIKCSSEADQKHVFDALELAMSVDFPPNVRDHRAGAKEHNRGR